MASKDIYKNPCKQEGSEEREGKAVAGTVEVTVRVMGENGEWMERSVRTDSRSEEHTSELQSRE